jgi:hypothetical protein
MAHRLPRLKHTQQGRVQARQRPSYDTRSAGTNAHTAPAGAAAALGCPSMNLDRSPPQCALTKERLELLRQLDDWFDTPMLVLAFAWLALLVVELVWGLTPLLETIGTAIWAVFLLDFALRFALAPGKLAFLRQRWLTAVAHPAGEVQPSDQRWSAWPGHALKRPLSSLFSSQVPLAWVSGALVVAVGLSFWLLSQHGVRDMAAYRLEFPPMEKGRDRPQPASEHATDGQAVRTIIWGD